jgi:hypothetical protein
MSHNATSAVFHWWRRAQSCPILRGQNTFRIHILTRSCWALEELLGAETFLGPIVESTVFLRSPRTQERSVLTPACGAQEQPCHTLRPQEGFLCRDVLGRPCSHWPLSLASHPPPPWVGSQWRCDGQVDTKDSD